MEQLQRQLDQSSIDLRRIDQEIDDLRGKASELVVLQEKLKGFAEVGGPDAARINAAHLAKTVRGREEKIPAAFTAALKKLARDLGASESAFQAAVDSQLADDVRQSPNSDVFARFVGELDAVRKQLDLAVRGISDAPQAAEVRLMRLSSELPERHAVKEADYRAIIAASEEQSGRTPERPTLHTS